MATCVDCSDVAEFVQRGQACASRFRLLKKKVGVDVAKVTHTIALFILANDKPYYI